MGGGRQGEPSTVVAAAVVVNNDDDDGGGALYPSFVPEKFYDEHVIRAEQCKELAELRAESIPGTGQVLHTLVDKLTPVLDKGAELRKVWDRIQGELQTEHEEEAAYRKKEAEVARGEDQELERLALDMKRAENVLAKQKARISAELEQVQNEVATVREQSEREHAAAEEMAKEELDAIQSAVDAKVDAYEADQKAKTDAFRADMSEQIASVDNDIAEEAANWAAEQARLNEMLEELKGGATRAEQPVRAAQSNLAQVKATREVAYRPVNAAEDALNTHVANAATAHAAMQQANAQTDKGIADDELAALEKAKAREKKEREEEDAEQQALYEASDAAFAKIEETKKDNEKTLAETNASLAEDDANAERLKEAMDAVAVDMNREEDKLALMLAEHAKAKSAEDAKMVKMEKDRTNKLLELKDAREQVKMEKGSVAEGEQAQVMQDIEKQELANNAAARENVRKIAKVREEIVKLAETTKSAEQVLTVAKAEADFANGKEEEVVNKEEKKNATLQANWDERNSKWNHDLDGAKTELEFLKEQLKTINAEDSEYSKKLFEEAQARGKAISNAEKDNRQKLIDERKEFADMIGKESVRLVQEDLDEMNRITLGRSAIEEATVAREEFEKEFAVKLDAVAEVQEGAENLLRTCDAQVKAAAGQEQLEQAKEKAAVAAAAREALQKEQEEARLEAEKRVDLERRRMEEQVMSMRDAFSDSKALHTMNLFDRVSRFNSRQQLGATELEAARIDIERRRVELEAMRTNLADAVAMWPQRLKDRQAALEALQADEAAVPPDDEIRRLEIRTHILSAQAQMAVSTLEEPDRAIRVEAAAIEAAEKRLKVATEAELKWSEQEGARLAAAEDALKEWEKREEARIAAYEQSMVEAIASMEALTSDSMAAEFGIAEVKGDIFEADRAELESAAEVSLAETSAVSAELSGIRASMNECFTMFQDEEFKFEKQSREIEKDNAKALRALDVAEKEKEKRIIQKKADLEQKKKDGEEAAVRRAEEMEKEIKQMYADHEASKIKDADDLESRKARPLKKTREVDAMKAQLATLETRYADEKKKWEEEKRKLDAALAVIKSKRDEVAAAQGKLVDTAQKAYDKALAAQNKKEDQLKKNHEDYRVAEENAEAAIVQAKLDEVETMKKRLQFVDEDIAEIKAEDDKIIAQMAEEAATYKEECATRESERVAVAAALDASVQPYRDSHVAAKKEYTEAATSLRTRREEAQAAADARVKVAEENARKVQEENMRKSDEAGRRAEDRALARARDAAAVDDAIAARRATLAQEMRATADYAQDAQVHTAELTALLQLQRDEVEPHDRALADAELELETAEKKLEQAKLAVTEGHPKNVLRAEKVHAKAEARLSEEKKTLTDEVAAGIAELESQTAKTVTAWKKEAETKIMARRKIFDDKLAHTRSMLEARMAAFQSETDEEVAAIQEEIATAEAEHAAAVKEAKDKREAREAARQKARVDAKEGRELRIQIFKEEYEEIEKQVVALSPPIDDAETEFEEAMVGLEANAVILQEQEFEKERSRLAEEMQAKKREMAAAIAAEKARAAEAAAVLEKQQERAIMKMEAEAAAERAKVAAEMAKIEAERLMLEAEAAEMDYAKGEVQLRELSANLLNVPTQRPSSAKGKVGSLREEIAATSSATDMTPEELAVFEEEKRRMQVELMLMDQELANLGK